MTNVIFVPQADLTFISGTLYELDTDQFRLELKAIEASAEGMPFPDTHRHNTEVSVAGVTYARVIEILAPYTVQFEDGQYAVRLVGSNNNIFDEGIIVRNQVSVISTNSAGLQIVTSGSGITEQDKLDIADRVWDEVAAQHVAAGSTGASLRNAALAREAGVAVVTGPYTTGQVLAKDSENQVDIFLRLNADHHTPATGLTGGSMTISISKGGASLSVVTPTVSEIGLGWYSLTMTSDMCDTVGPLALVISSSSTDTYSGVLEIDVKPDNTPGAITNVITPTTTQASTTLPGTMADMWKGSFIRFTTGTLAGQVRKVSGYQVTNSVLLYDATTAAPSTGDRFVLINS